MRTLTFAALLVSLTWSASPVEAQRLGGNGAQSTSVRSAPSMSRGNWSAPRPGGGNWNGPRPTPPAGGWNNGPRPTPPAGGWHNNPRPPKPGNWNGPRPTPPAGGWHNNPRPPKPGNWNNTPRPGGWNHNGPRWGNKIGGHWYAGHNAPGGWKGYRRPYRGWTLPSYWIAPSFYISDYSSYGLSAPPYGYNWSRYYDDAVLMDQRGQVWDSVSGLDWDRYDDGAGYDDGYYDDGQDGYVDQGAPYPVPPVVYGEPAEVVQGGGYGSSYQQGGYVSGGYWYPPVTTTTVTVSQAPAEVITTTTEYIDTVTYTAPRKSYAKKKVWRPKTKVRQCACQCRC